MGRGAGNEGEVDVDVRREIREMDETIEGVRAITYPNPLEVQKSAELIERYRVTLLCTTPTFLRAFMRKTEPHQFASVKLLVAGAKMRRNKQLKSA